MVTFLTYRKLLEFARDFCLAPDLVSKSFCLSSFKDIVNGGVGGGGSGAPLVDISDVVHAETLIGLSFDQFLSFLAYIAGECKWFARKKDKKKDSDKKKQHQQVRGVEATTIPCLSLPLFLTSQTTSLLLSSQVLALLQWLDTSPGKSKINKIRGTSIIPTFKFCSNAENYTQISQFLM